MVQLVWIDNQGERQEEWFRDTSVMCHSIWKKWPNAMISWKTCQVTILVDEKEKIVATIICE